MADPALPQALPDDPSLWTDADPARGAELQRPSNAQAREPDAPIDAAQQDAPAAPFAAEAWRPGVGARTGRDHLAIAAELGVETPRFSQADQPELFAAWSDRIDQLLVHAERGEPERFEALKRETNAYAGHPQPAAPLDRPAPEDLRESMRELLAEAPTPRPERALNSKAMAARWDGIERDAEQPAAPDAARSERDAALGKARTQITAFDGLAAPSTKPLNVEAGKTTRDPRQTGERAVQPPSAAAAEAVPTNPTPAAAAVPRAEIREPSPASATQQAAGTAAHASDPITAAAPHEQQAAIKIPGVAALAVNTLADALRRRPQDVPAAAGNAASAAAETPTTPDAKTPPTRPSLLDAARDTVESLALNSLLKNFRRQQPPAEPVAPEAFAAADRDAKVSIGPEGADAAPPPGGARDKLALFDAARMQSRRDLDQVKGAANAGAAALRSVAALEQQESAAILSRIRDAAEASGGIERVLSEMRPGGAYEDLRKEFNVALARDEGFGAAYDEAAGALAGYASERADLAAIVKARPETSLARLEALDQDIVKAVAHLPGKEDGKGALDEALANGKEALETAFAAVRDAFTRDGGQTVRGPSPSPSLGG